MTAAVKSLAEAPAPETEAALASERKKRQQLEFELKLGKLKKVADLGKTRRRIAQLMTQLNREKSGVKTNTK